MGKDKTIVKIYQGWTITTGKSYNFEVYQPEDDPEIDYPDWECDSLDEAIDFIDSAY